MIEIVFRYIVPLAVSGIMALCFYSAFHSSYRKRVETGRHLFAYIKTYIETEYKNLAYQHKYVKIFFVICYAITILMYCIIAVVVSHNIATHLSLPPIIRMLFTLFGLIIALAICASIWILGRLMLQRYLYFMMILMPIIIIILSANLLIGGDLLFLITICPMVGTDLNPIIYDSGFIHAYYLVLGAIFHIAALCGLWLSILNPNPFIKREYENKKNYLLLMVLWLMALLIPICMEVIVSGQYAYGYLSDGKQVKDSLDLVCFALGTFFAGGFSDIAPHHPVSKMVTVGINISGFLYCALFVGTVVGKIVKEPGKKPRL